MEIHELKAGFRKESGKGSARRLRKAGLIPAILYGPHREPIHLTVNSTVFTKLLRHKDENVFINLIIDERKKTDQIAIIKELQIDPISRRFLHVDFCEIDMEHEIVLDIPIHLTGTPKGTESGGELHHLKRDLKVSCLPAVLPEFIEVDVTGLEIGDAMKVQDLLRMEGVAFLDHDDTVIATVTSAKVPLHPVKEEEQEPSEQET